jgi:hypothetical protein
MRRSRLIRELQARPEADVRVKLGGYLIGVTGVSYNPDHESVVILLHPGDTIDVLTEMRQGWDTVINLRERRRPRGATDET